MNGVGLRRYLTGDDLVTLRSKIGWSQQAVAEYLGLRHEEQLNQIESGRRWISYAEEALLRQLEDAFDNGQLPTATQQPHSGSSLRMLQPGAKTAKEIREHPAQSIYERRSSPQQKP
jgi:transcriptional regulator with XRE-family HTH domain